ncbi:hypothetical protein LPJ74_003400 [Coemansia sp. RSA 1843]|nr:hypothetical protein LPJ74_003400 [Coemansia sp. RSA 1843]
MPFATTGRQQSPYRVGTLRDTRAFARLSQFIWLFQEPLKIEDVDFGRLESELCDLLPSEPDEQLKPPILMQAIKRSLRILTGNRNMEDKKMDAYIARAWDKYMGPYGKTLPMDYENLGLFGLGAGDRTRIALDTCELIFCRPDNLRSIGAVATKLAEDPVQWRMEPLGVDNLGRKYYLLCESRLYRETPKSIADLLLGEHEKDDDVVDEEQQVPEQAAEEDHQPEDGSGRRRSTRLVASAKEADKKKRKAAAAAAAAEEANNYTLPVPSAEDIEFADPPQHRMREDDGDLWELVCSSAKEWSEYPKVFCRSRKKNESALYRMLTEAAPPIVQKLNSAARRRQTQEAMLQRKRSSRIALRKLLHDEAEAEAHVYNGSYSSGYSSSMDGDYVPGSRRSKRLRSARLDGLAGPGTAAAASALAPGQRIVESRNVRAQRREEARKAALDSSEAEKAVRQVAEVAAMTDGSQLSEAEGYRATVYDDPKEEEEKEEGEFSGPSGEETEHEAEDQNDGNGGGDDWMFSCSCGKTGHNYDDGRTMTACEKCSVWRHLGCALRAEAQRIGEDIHEDDWESMHYVCPNCRNVGERETAVSVSKPAGPPASGHAFIPGTSFGHVQSNA